MVLKLKQFRKSNQSSELNNKKEIKEHVVIKLGQYLTGRKAPIRRKHGRKAVMKNSTVIINNVQKSAKAQKSLSSFTDAEQTQRNILYIYNKTELQVGYSWPHPCKRLEINAQLFTVVKWFIFNLENNYSFISRLQELR
jgi:hypothetical protein